MRYYIDLMSSKILSLNFIHLSTLFLFFFSFQPNSRKESMELSGIGMIQVPIRKEFDDLEKSLDISDYPGKNHFILQMRKLSPIEVK